jgi:hypothetical protein
MNPEFQRNLWLELSPRRMVLMAVILGLFFFAAAVTEETAAATAETARWLFYLIVVVWGTRNAALSVVGEIRERTWDGQRLSSLGAGEMMWGKLFGSTSYAWFGGVLCLAVILSDLFVNQGPLVALIELVYYLAIGVIAQAASLLASLVAAGRRQTHSQFEVFLYQVFGLAAAGGVYWIWSIADPAGSLLAYARPTDFVVWWGQSWDARGFLLLSLAIFTGWTLVGCYTRMRLELKMRNGPYIWLAFLAFIGLYVCGFDAWLSENQALTHLDAIARRLLLAGTAYAALAYIMVFLEPKDRVHLRWLGGAFAKGSIGAGLAGLQGWMTALSAALLMGVVLILWLGKTSGAPDQAILGAMLGFLTRDMAVVTLAGVTSRRNGDFAAVCALVALYALLPVIVGGMKFDSGLVLFLPRASEPLWLSPLAAWAEAIVAVLFAVGRIALDDKPTAA